MIDLRRPISELTGSVRAGDISATDLVQTSLDRIAETAEYHAVVEVNPQALDRAAEVDRRIKNGEDLALAGIPFIAKDNFLTRDTHTTAASNILKPFRAPYQSVAIERLEAAGAVMVAKANLDAFAHGSSTENSDFGPTKNPHDTTRVPGGSSGGSAAAVALGQAVFALGTDTGGSIRLPASYCGVVGLKPTYGLVPRTGVVAMGSSVDVIGPITNSTADAAAVLDIIAGQDHSDATSIDRDEAAYTSSEEKSVRGLKIGLIKEYLGEGLEPAISQSFTNLVTKLESEGAKITEITLPATELALAAYYILVPAEVSSNLARYDGVKYGYSSYRATNLEETYRLSREEGFGAEAKRRILTGTYVLSSGYYDAYYKRAQAVRTKMIEQFIQAFSEYDFLLGPTAPTVAFPLGANAQDPLAMYLNDVMTVAVNLVGSPAVSIPLGTVGNLPYGIQLIGPQRSERSLLAAAGAVETLIGDWKKS